MNAAAAAAALRTINAVPAMLAYWSASERCVFANAAYRAWFGQDPDELIGRSMQELLGPLYELNLPYIRGVLAGQPQQFDREITMPDGQLRHSFATYTPDVVDGVVVGFTALVTDVTQARMREETLRRTTELLDRTGELAKVGGAELDLRTGQVFWSKEMGRILEVDPDYVPSPDRWGDFFEPEALPAFLAVREGLRATGTPIDFETPMITAKGRRIWVRIQASSVVENGTVVKLISAHKDITDRRKSEDALRASEAFATGVLNSISDQVAVVDSQGIITAVNQAWRRFAEENGAPQLAAESVGSDYLRVLDNGVLRADGDEARDAALGLRAVLAGTLDSYSLTSR